MEDPQHNDDQLPTDLVAIIKTHLKNVQANLKSGGPPVDWKQIHLFQDGLLAPNEAAEIRKQIETWRSWYNARLEVMIAMCDQEQED